MTAFWVTCIVLGCLRVGWWLHGQHLIDEGERRLAQLRNQPPRSHCRTFPARAFDQDRA